MKKSKATAKPTPEVQPVFKGFKVFNPDFTCLGFQFAEGQEFTEEGDPELCRHGFHFCPKALDCFEYYGFDPNNIVCEVEAIGRVDGLDSEGNLTGNKLCTNKIRIVRRLTWFQVLSIVNTGKNNTGLANTGDLNTGDLNTGDWNTGDLNTGDRNTGNLNTGDLNTGDLNTGDLNTGDWNTGDWNTGDRNTGDRNTGNLNTGDLNTGDWNTGDWNTGDWNTGDWNTGDRNTGNLNTGDRNTGDWNTGNDSIGVFCTESAPTIPFFNKPSDWSYEKWRNSEAAYLRWQVKLTEWIDWSDMSTTDREAFPRAETQGGYLKRNEYKEAHRIWWDSLDERQRKVITGLPNFDAEIFKSVTGIEL